MEQKKIHYETVLTGFLMQKASAAKIPLSGTFELTPVCNFNCKMCYVRKSQAEVDRHCRRMMTVEQWLQIARRAREQGMLYLLLTGGEPLIWPGFWELYEKLSEMGFLISINTNGSLIDETVVERFRRHPPVRLNITLYGAGEQTYRNLCRTRGGFARVDRAISLLRAAGIQVKLNGSLTPDNAQDLAEMVEYANQRDLIFEVNTYMLPPLRRDPGMVGRNERFTPQQAAYWDLEYHRLRNGEQAYRKFLEQIRQGVIPAPGLDESCVDPVDGKIRCRAGKAAFWITWDGYMTPCGMMPEPKVDLTVKCFEDAWKELTELAAGTRLSGVCSTCPNQRLCHACAAMAMAETGSAAGIPRYLCEMIMEMRRLAWAENKEPLAVEG